MGLLSWLFPTPEDRLKRARDLVAAKQYAAAREELADLDVPGARDLLQEAENQLARMNLTAALEWCQAGDDHRVAQHLELAEQFHHGGLEDLFRDTRLELREVRRERRERQEEARSAAQEVGLDPMRLDPTPSVTDPMVPPDLYDPDDAEVAARLALLVDGYPEPLRAQLPALGQAFARAAIDLDDGRADLALEALLALPDDSAPVLFQRARASHHLGDPVAAAAALAKFAEHAPGHLTIGNVHTGVYRAQLLAEAGDPAGALVALRSTRKDDPSVGAPLLATLLFQNGQLVEAEQVTVTLLRSAPTDAGLYLLLSAIRERAGRRVEAMAALERFLQSTHCPPGRCGHGPPNAVVLTRLATLYLEDRIEQKRAFELADQALGLVQEPDWESAYLAALLGRARGDDGVEPLVNELWETTRPGTPQRARLEQHLAG